MITVSSLLKDYTPWPHYRRDVTFEEDWSQLRVGKAPEVNAVINNTVIALLLGQGVTNVPQARREFDYQFHKILLAPSIGS
ncbi:MAG: hypothetical protein WCS37_20910 [Chloroflexota bacterium]